MTLGTCEVYAEAVDEIARAPGEPLTIQGSPFTTAWDTTVFVGGVETPVLQVDRVGCETCDTCRVQQACTVCSDCDECDRICREQCSETVTVLVPELDSGDTQFWLINRHGRSVPASLIVRESEAVDTGDGAR